MSESVRYGVQAHAREVVPLPLLTCLPPLPGKLANQEATDNQQDARAKHPESHAARAGKEALIPLAIRWVLRHCRSHRPTPARRSCNGLRGPGEAGSHSAPASGELTGVILKGQQVLRRLATLATSKSSKGAQRMFLYFYSEDFFASTVGGNSKRVSALQVADGVLFGVPVFFLARL
jgi:hypothetical protein